MEHKVPEAIELYLAGRTKKRAFTKDCIISLLTFIFKVKFDSSKKKADLLELLNTQHAEHPDLLGDACSGYATRDAVPALPPATCHLPIADTPPPASDASEHSEHAVISPTHNDNESEDEVAATDEVTASASAAFSRTRWLYSQACKAGTTELTPLQLSLSFVGCIEQARKHSKFARSVQFAKLLKDVLKMKMKVDLKFMVEFINPVAASINDLVDDEELNEENLREITYYYYNIVFKHP